jgi:putative heme-binding domain-containing protein
MKQAIISIFLLFAANISAAPLPSFQLKDGDRVAFLGDTLIERMQEFNHLELRLTTAWPKRNIIFRNIGWSGDTPRGISRAGLSLLQAGREPADEGWKQLQKQIELVKPTVVFLGYGMASSFAGESVEFRAQMQTLMDAIRKQEPKVRFVILSPLRHEALSDGLPNPTQHNIELLAYSEILRTVAKEKGAHFVDFFNKPAKRQRFTQNGIHAHEAGYRQIAEEICRHLKMPTHPRLGTLQAVALREIIRRKNKLFFDRSRPQNMAYIFGFRKHEQGNNAVEIPKFDPLIAAEEKKIAARRDLPPLKKQPPKKAGAVPANHAPFTPQKLPEFDTMDGIEINLFAENPSLAKPIQMNFDPQGRLWVATSSVYPQVKPGQVADDKIIVLEDTTGDGRADKTTVFADGLFIPTGIEPGDGGAYVAQSTQLLHLADTNGDGRADQKRIILSGFGTEDTHHTLHTLRWGHDGRLYFNQSIYIRSHVETPHGVVRLKSGGIWHLRPDTLRLGIAYRGWCNPWGHHFDEFGNAFVTDGAGFQGISYAIPGAMYFTYAGARRIMDSISPGNYPKFAGLEILNSPHFPKSFRGAAITCDYRAHRIVRFTLSENGAGFAAKHEGDFIRSSATSFRPIDVKQGPDGALYIADWSNPIIQHGEVDFRDPRRDKVHGRIWRVTFKNHPIAKKQNFQKLKNEALFNILLTDNQYDKRQARRVLHERKREILPDLKKWLAQHEENEIAQLEALWLHDAVDVVNATLLMLTLEANDARVRTAAMRVLSHWHDRLRTAELHAAAGIRDPHPRARLEAMRVYAEMKNSSIAHQYAKYALQALDSPMDTFLDYGLWLTLNDLADPFMRGMKNGALNFADKRAHAEFALRSLDAKKSVALIGQLVRQRKLPRDGRGPLIELIGTVGGASELAVIFSQLKSGGFDAAVHLRVLTALASAARLRNARPGGELKGLGNFIDAKDAATRDAAIRLAGAWKQQTQVAKLLALAKGGNSVAFASLGQIRGGKATTGLRALAAEKQPLPLRQQAARTLAVINLRGNLRQVFAVLKATKDSQQALELWRVLLQQKGAGAALAEGVGAAQLPKPVVTAGIRAAREGGRNEKLLVAALARSQNIALLTKQMTSAELKALAARAMKEGDPFAGEKIYRRTELACTVCHAIGGAGGKVGPDFTSLGTSAQPDYIIESLWYPNRKIKEGYHTTVVETKDNRTLAGVVVRDAGGELVLRDLANKLVSIPKNQIRKKTAVPVSMMTPGLITGLAEDEQLHLYRFLAELGKAGPFDATQTGVARTWRLLPGTHRVEQYGIEKIVEADFEKKWFNHILGAGNGAGWKILPARVNGDLPAADIAQTASVGRNVGLVHVFAGTKFEMQKAGKAKFTLPKGIKAQAWLNGKSLGSANQFTAKVAAGKHRFVLRLDAKALPEVLRLESKDVVFLND